MHLPTKNDFLTLTAFFIFALQALPSATVLPDHRGPELGTAQPPSQPLTQAAVLETWEARHHLSGLHHQEMQAFPLDVFGPHQCTHDAGAMSQCPRTPLSSPINYVMKAHMVLPVFHNQHILVPTNFSVRLLMSKNPAFFHFSHQVHCTESRAPGRPFIVLGSMQTLSWDASANYWLVISIFSFLVCFSFLLNCLFRNAQTKKTDQTQPCKAFIGKEQNQIKGLIQSIFVSTLQAAGWQPQRGHHPTYWRRLALYTSLENPSSS